MAWNDDVKQWIRDNNSSIKELSGKTCINAKSLSDYLRGRIQTLPDEKRKSLYEATKLEILAKSVGKISYNPAKKKAGESVKETVKEKINEKDNLLYNAILDLEAKVNQMKNTYAKPASKEEYKGKAKEISDVFYSILEKMEYLKSAPAEEREKLTKAINPKDMGYFISFMNAIYKPDTFNTWLMNAGYIINKPRGNKK